MTFPKLMTEVKTGIYIFEKKNRPRITYSEHAAAPAARDREHSLCRTEADSGEGS